MLKALPDQDDSGTGDSGARDCEWGFEWDGSACVDIDECAADNGGCGDAPIRSIRRRRRWRRWW